MGGGVRFLTKQRRAHEPYEGEGGGAISKNLSLAHLGEEQGCVRALGEERSRKYLSLRRSKAVYELLGWIGQEIDFEKTHVFT